MLVIYPLIIEDLETGARVEVEIDEAEFFGVYEKQEGKEEVWVMDFPTHTAAKLYVYRRNSLH
jgi:hypothetical protein